MKVFSLERSPLYFFVIKTMLSRTTELTRLTGRTRPLRVTSPVMAVSERTQRPLKREARTATMVIPADGPSLPTAPAGKWMWTSVFSRLPQENPYCNK